MSTALFQRLDHDRFQPSEYTRGPWDPRAMHGGAPSALLAGVLQHVLADPAVDRSPMHPARLTIDLERPVGLVPLTVHSSVVRAGKKVRVAEAALFDDAGTRLARASLLGIRTVAEPIDISEAVLGQAVAPPPLPSGPVPIGPSPFTDSDGPLFHSHAVEHRFVRGAMGVAGPATDWISLLRPVIEGEAITPLQRVAAAADFGNGVGAAVATPWSFINPDLTITLQRLPIGEWVCLDSATYFSIHGVGTAESELWDTHGRLGRSLQNLLVEPPA
ncbi:MAG: thioesterase family protein [Actinomycetota bacterium]|nr:thioesterase family protein [Actinomycetota bacterium]